METTDMDTLAEAIVQALREEALNMGCAGTHEAEVLSDLLDRLVRRIDHLAGKLEGTGLRRLTGG